MTQSEMEPTYKLYPKASDECAKGGWKYSFDLLEKITDTVNDCGYGGLTSMEDVELILLVIENLPEEANED